LYYASDLVQNYAAPPVIKRPEEIAAYEQLLINHAEAQEARLLAENPTPGRIREREIEVELDGVRAQLN